jgi:hypothetical protein
MRGTVHFTVAAARQLRDAPAAEVGVKPRFQQVELTEGTPMPKPSVNQSKRDRQHDAAFAKAGNTKMHKPQAAGLAKSGQTGKAQTPAPGAKRASGGPRTTGYSLALPAVGGHTAPIHKGREK